MRAMPRLRTSAAPLVLPIVTPMKMEWKMMPASRVYTVALASSVATASYCIEEEWVTTQVSSCSSYHDTSNNGLR